MAFEYNTSWKFDDEYRRKLWYLEPLHFEDIFAGCFLILFGCITLPLYVVVAYVIYKNDKDIIGFRYLFSASIADILLLINYSIWPGITIIAKSEIVKPWIRSWIQIYLDWAWFSMYYHYVIIAWSRFAAIRFASSFRIQTRIKSYLICAACYACALIQVMATHFQSWYVTFYYDPSAYGIVAENFEKYLNNGQSLFFFIFHLLMMIIITLFYGCAIWILIKHRKTSIFVGSRYAKNSTNIEARLLIPCIFNSVIFIIGQIVITIGTGKDKWASWTVLLFFSANSAVNPILLLTFSAIIRQNTWEIVNSLKIKTLYRNNIFVRNKKSHSLIPLTKKKPIASLIVKEKYHAYLLHQISEPIIEQLTHF